MKRRSTDALTSSTPLTRRNLSATCCIRSEAASDYPLLGGQRGSENVPVRPSTVICPRINADVRAPTLQTWRFSRTPPCRESTYGTSWPTGRNRRGVYAPRCFRWLPAATFGHLRPSLSLSQTQGTLCWQHLTAVGAGKSSCFPEPPSVRATLADARAQCRRLFGSRRIVSSIFIWIDDSYWTRPDPGPLKWHSSATGRCT
jgi:hypothetical protein